MFRMLQIWQRHSTTCVVSTPKGRQKPERKRRKPNEVSPKRPSKKADAKDILTDNFNNK